MVVEKIQFSDRSGESHAAYGYPLANALMACKQSRMQVGINRRDDIQGLRALAVLAVIFYHFGIWPFSGGFVGVDVFFVISGYLITKKIDQDVRAGRFSLMEFTRSRGRRLLPALAACIAVTFATAAVLFSPQDFQNASASTVFAALAASNVYFWLQADYFDSAAILKPLLHTWSLAVEIQFYLIWPFAVVALKRFEGQVFAIAMAAITLTGLVLAIAVMRVDDTGAFFLTPFRMWEFAAGGLVYAIEKKTPASAAFNNFAYVAGAFAVIFSILMYDDATPFPGLNAVLPVLGTALLILAGSRSRLATPLCSKPSVYVGEISYSLYLVHWPIIVFLRYGLTRPLTLVDYAIFLGIIFTAAMASYHFIEKPFRQQRRAGALLRPSIVYVASVALVVPIASTSWAGDGWSWRMPEELRSLNQIDMKAMRAHLWRKFVKMESAQFPAVHDKPNVLVIGDSQAADVVNMLVDSGAAENLNIKTKRTDVRCGTVYVGAGNSTYWTQENVRTIKEPQFIATCEAYLDNIFGSPDLKSADVVIVSNLWAIHSIPYLKQTVAKLQDGSLARILIAGRKDLGKSSLEFINQVGRLDGADRWAANARDRSADAVNEAIKMQVGSHYIDMMALACPTSASCSVLTRDHQPVFFDNAHLTPAGAKLLGERLMQLNILPTPVS